MRPSRKPKLLEAVSEDAGENDGEVMGGTVDKVMKHCVRVRPQVML